MATRLISPIKRGVMLEFCLSVQIHYVTEWNHLSKVPSNLLESIEIGFIEHPRDLTR